MYCTTEVTTKSYLHRHSFTFGSRTSDISLKSSLYAVNENNALGNKGYRVKKTFMWSHGLACDIILCSILLPRPPSVRSCKDDGKMTTTKLPSTHFPNKLSKQKEASGSKSTSQTRLVAVHTKTLQSQISYCSFKYHSGNA